MILRVVRGHVPSGAKNTFYERVDKALLAIRGQDGLISVQIGRQHGTDGDDFIFVSLWRDLDAIYSWVDCSDLLRVPAAPGGYEDLVGEMDVQHYDVFDATAVG